MKLTKDLKEKLVSEITAAYGTPIVTTVKMNKILRENGFVDQKDLDVFRDSCHRVQGYTYNVSLPAGGKKSPVAKRPVSSKAVKPASVRSPVRPMNDEDEEIEDFEDSENYPVDAVVSSSLARSSVESVSAPAPVGQVHSIVNEDVYVPEKDGLFVPWGNYAKVETIISSMRFFPIYISGDSGNGKSIMIEQGCAKSYRTFIRVQINSETTEDDLIGGFRLLNGETVFVKGPVIKAMEAGSILLLDEIDRGSNLLLCLQGILEGKPFLIKKTGEVVVPAEGFNVIATGNSKGRGDETGKFDSSILDDAFLERFRVLFNQEYPNAAIEKKILAAKMHSEGVYDEELLDRMVLWVDALRKSYKEKSVDNCISTRRSCGIIETLAIFGNIEEAIELSTNRFDESTQEAFLELWKLTDKSGSNQNT